MALYEIRTLKTRHRISLISYGDFQSDLAAILAARTLIRSGEALEIWRGEVLVYRRPRYGTERATTESPARIKAATGPSKGLPVSA
ncbi:MAG TPA: hypothetical protein VMZ30_10810 [Pyrinomonadaceae bacterium]|nr:hypothetical protein [Pyrinomonadaceae bacterium]